MHNTQAAPKNTRPAASTKNMRGEKRGVKQAPHYLHPRTLLGSQTSSR